MTPKPNVLLADQPDDLWGLRTLGHFKDPAHRESAVRWMRRVCAEYGSEWFFSEVVVNHTPDLHRVTVYTRLLEVGQTSHSAGQTALLVTAVLREEVGLPPIASRTVADDVMGRVEWTIMVVFNGNRTVASEATTFNRSYLRTHLSRGTTVSDRFLAEFAAAEPCERRGVTRAWLERGEGPGPLLVASEFREFKEHGVS